MIEKPRLYFNGRIDIPNRKNITLCCENLPNDAQVPGISLSDSPEDDLCRFMGLRNMLLTNAMKGGVRPKLFGDFMGRL